MAGTRPVLEARVASVARLSPSFLRVVLAGDDLARLGCWGPDQRIKLLFPSPSSGACEYPDGGDAYAVWRALPVEERSPMRTYTIRANDRAARTLTVDFVVHGDAGPASRWVQRAAEGDDLLVIGPEHEAGPSGGFEWQPGAANRVLLAGDETAVPAISAILESLPADAVGHAFLEVPDAADALEIAAPTGVTVTWLPREGDATGVRLDQAVRAWARTAAESVEHEAAGAETLADPAEDVLLWDSPGASADARFFAWLAGEAGAITGIRRHLVNEVGIDRRRIAFMGYWRAGRPEN